MQATVDPSTPKTGLLISVVITTYDRCDALVETLRALDAQTLAPEEYEVVVVDNGCRDGTEAFLRQYRMGCGMQTFRVPENVGIAAARNLAIRHARGRYLVLVSDDLIVPPDFLETHVETLQRYPGTWVVGGLQQLPSLTDTPFGRYLDALESSYDEARKSRQLAPGIWELSNPTARNLSLPRADLDRIGLFDEQFRTACEDVDLAERARQAGIRFIYAEAIRSLHNDQLGDWVRFCRAQVPRTRDTVHYYFKHQAHYRTHGDPAVARLNTPVRLCDGPRLIVKKLAKRVLASALVTPVIELFVRAGERIRLPDPLLWRLYRLLVGIYMYRGWQTGMAHYTPGTADAIR